MNFMKKIIESRTTVHESSADHVETDTGLISSTAPSEDILVLSDPKDETDALEQDMTPSDGAFCEKTPAPVAHDNDQAAGTFEAADLVTDTIETLDNTRHIEGDVEQIADCVSAAVERDSQIDKDTPHVYSRRISPETFSSDAEPANVDEDPSAIENSLLNADIASYLENINNTLQNASENTEIAAGNSILNEVRRASIPTQETTSEQPATAQTHLGLNSKKVAEPRSVASQAVHRRTNRAKTRLLGFESAQDDSSNPFSTATTSPVSSVAQPFAVGWIAVTDGPGRGNSFALHTGVSQIGRGEDQAVRLNYGDNSISRSNHAAIAYDHEQNKFFLGHGGKANLVRLNGNPVLSTEELCDGDIVEIGETKLRFVAFCDTTFNWGTPASQSESAHA